MPCWTLCPGYVRPMGMSEIFDGAIGDWQRERPDLELDAMGPVIRILAAANLTRRIGEQLAASEGLAFGEYEVLAVLRRSPGGAPVKAGPLAQSVWISPGGLTNRLDRLEAAKLITRRRDPADGRSSLIGLTAKGRKKVDAIFTKVTASGTSSFSVLSAKEVAALVGALDRVIDHTLAEVGTA